MEGRKGLLIRIKRMWSGLYEGERNGFHNPSSMPMDLVSGFVSLYTRPFLLSLVKSIRFIDFILLEKIKNKSSGSRLSACVCERGSSINLDESEDLLFSNNRRRRKDFSSMRMRAVAAIWWLTLVAAASRLSFLHASSPPSTTVPAFLWSPHHPHHQMTEVVNYQTISSKDLARSVLSEGGWSNLLCSEKKVQQSMDLALVFVGRGLSSTDVSANKNTDPALVNLLKVFYTKSNFSMAFPYVAASEEAMENSLVSGFAEACGQDLGISNVAFSESCSVEGENFQKLANLHAINDYLASRMEKRPSDHTDLVVFCYEGSNSMKGLDQPQSESEIFSELISSVEMLGGKYSALYVSDPFRSIQLPYHQELERFLAESAAANASMNSTHCDEVCQIKSSLLEGVLVGIVLLIILISGLCCMMGIDTPTRFEAPQDS